MQKIQIRLLRERLGLSQGQLAEMLGVHQTAVSRWETGITKPERKIRQKLLDLVHGPCDTSAIQRLMRIVDNARIPMVLANSDWTIAAASQGAAQLNGLPARDCIGRNYERWMNAVTRDHWEKARAHGFLTGDVAAVRFNARLQLFNGQTAFLQGAWHALQDRAQGEVFILAEAMQVDSADGPEWWEVVGVDDWSAG